MSPRLSPGTLPLEPILGRGLCPFLVEVQTFPAVIDGGPRVPSRVGSEHEQHDPPTVTVRLIAIQLDKAIREIVTHMLTSAGYECRVAPSPTEAWDILSSGEAVELICSGITEWPEEDFKRMVETFPDVPVVVSTATLDAALMRNAYQMGAYDFLLRPFDREQLIFAVQRALEYRRLKLESRDLKAKLGETGKTKSTVSQ
jgi:DNA-binding NtrC family response regulator